jgi:type VI secretion system protein ImpC
MNTQINMLSKNNNETILSEIPCINQLYQSLNIDLPVQQVAINDFSSHFTLAERTLGERVTAALQVLMELVQDASFNVERIDQLLLDYFIANIDITLNQQLDELLHHSDFQKLEANWTSLKYLIDHTDFRSNIKIELLDIDKEALREDLSRISDITQSGLYNHIYIQEYDTPGGEPISAMITGYEFEANAPDIQLLSNLAKIASVTHCPVIGAISPKFFYKDSYNEVMRIGDLINYMTRAEYIRWTSFRETEEARYIGLTLPRFLLRLPYGDNNPVRSFIYSEDVTAGENAKYYLWGNASFAFAINMVRSFKKHGWTVNIRGPESGGKVENLLLHQYNSSRGLLTKIPSEILIPETRELELAQLGFIPLSYYKNSDYACFFSANSLQKPIIYSTPEATANSRINALLPYLFLSSRLGHYLKVLQRENIGSSKSRDELENELNQWLQTLITKMNNPGPELMAIHPLREGQVTVANVPDNPGYYQVHLYAIPHFQVEGMDVKLSLVSQMPSSENKK